jgi:protein-disulfide isomerase
MALPPKFAAHRMTFGPPAPTAHASIPSSSHTLEIYLDYCCPFCLKIWRSLEGFVFPMIRENPAWASGVEFIMRQQIQPWHPSSTLMHEAALAVTKVAPDKYWDFSRALFERQAEYFDVNIVNEVRNDSYKRLAKLAAEVGVDEGKVYGLLKIGTKEESGGHLNSGNGVTNDVKTTVKMNRLVGVHVTPTVVFDGVVQDVSSGWTKEEWKEWLTKNVV